jgi:hypothetical protein
MDEALELVGEQITELHGFAPLLVGVAAMIAIRLLWLLVDYLLDD